MYIKHAVKYTNVCSFNVPSTKDNYIMDVCTQTLLIDIWFPVEAIGTSELLNN